MSSDKFLNIGGGGDNTNLSNGTATIFGNTIGAINLTPSYPVKTNSIRQIVSSKLDIADVNNLQSELDTKTVVDFTYQTTPSNPTVGNVSVYSKNDDKIYTLTSGGVEAELGGASYDQSLNTTDEVQFKKVILQPTSGDKVPLKAIDFDATSIGAIDQQIEFRDNLDALGMSLSMATGDVKLTNQQPSGSITLETGGTTLVLDDIDNSTTVSGSIDASSYKVGGVAGSLVKTIGSTLTVGSGSGVSGSSNILIGNNAGSTITTGANNIFIGENAGRLSSGVDTVNNSNTAVGNYAMENTTTGRENTYVGFYSGNQIIGRFNTAIGAWAMGDGVGVAEENTAVGWYALDSATTAQKNTAVGLEALVSVNTGIENTGLGYQAGNTLTTGKYNTLIGYGSDSSVNNGEYRVALGYNAISDTNNHCVLGSGTLGSTITAIKAGLTATTDLGESNRKFKDAYLSGQLSVLDEGILSSETPIQENYNNSWTVSTPTASEIDGIAYSPTLGLFVAVLTSGNAISSTDCVSWSSITLSGLWRAITWGGDRFIAVGTTSNKTAWSTDGITWNEVAPIENNSWSAITYSPSLTRFVAVSTDGTNQVMYSTDGTSWTSASASEVGSRNSITWSPELSLFVAVSSSGTNKIMSSPDGITWTNRTVSPNGAWRSICWSSELRLFVGVGDNGIFLTSKNGVDWVSATIGTTNWVSVIWVKELGYFFAGASSGTNRLIRSPNGVDWTEISFTTASAWYEICYAPNLGKLVLGAYNTTNNLAVSDQLTSVLTVSSSAIIPAFDNNSDIGSRGKAFRNGYFSGSIDCNMIFFNKPFFEMYADNSSTAVTCTVAGTYYDFVYNSGFPMGNINNTSFSVDNTTTGVITYNGSKQKAFHCGATISFYPSTVNTRIWTIGVRKNSETTPIEGSFVQITTTQNTFRYSTALHKILTLKTNDTMRLCVACNVAGETFTPTYVNMFGLATPNNGMI